MDEAQTIEFNSQERIGKRRAGQKRFNNLTASRLVIKSWVTYYRMINLVCSILNQYKNIRQHDVTYKWIIRRAFCV